MLQPIPTLPATIGQLIFRYEFDRRWQRNVFYFRGPVTLAFGWTFHDWWNEAIIWLITTQITTLPRDFGDISYWAFYNDGHFTHSDGTGRIAPNYAPFNSLDPALCPCFTKRSGIGRHNYGRLHAPACHSEMFLPDGTYDLVFISHFQNMAGRMNLPLFYLGQSYFPALYSPALGTFSNMSNIKFLQHPCYLRRRRLARDRDAPLYDYPVVP